MRNVWRSPNDLLAVRVSLAASIVGGLWVAYLFWYTGSFQPDVLRLVPVGWLLLSGYGLILGIETVLTPEQRRFGALSILICLANTPFAAVFAFAAMMAD